MKKLLKPVFTHRSVFHADEVFACAMLLLAGETEINSIHRVDQDEAERQKIGGAFILDTGREYDPERLFFDHHQGEIKRDNGKLYATAGLVWKQYGAGICKSKEIADRVDEYLIEGIDAHDADSKFNISANSQAGEVRTMTLSSIISSFNSDDIQNDELQIKGFREAVHFAKMILKKSIENEAKAIESKYRFEKISSIDQTGKIVTLSEFVPWRQNVSENYPDALFVVAPGSQSPYQVLAVPVNPETRDLKQNIERPEWFGGFIHQSKWIAGCETLEEAKKLADWQIKSK